MAGRPWERYKPQQPASTGKPWERYAPKPEPTTGVDLGPLPRVSARAEATLPESLEAQQDAFNESTTFGQRLGNNIRRGVQGFRTSVQAGLAGERMQTAADLEDDGVATVGGIPFTARPGEADQVRQKAAQNITAAIESQRRAAEIPQSPAVSAFTGAKTFDEGLSAFATDPLGIVGAVGVESTVQFLPALAVMAATRSPGAAVLAGGLNSAGLEYGGSLLEYLGDNGVDVGNAQAVQAALSDPEIAKAANEFAKTRAGIIATGDAATAGLASRVPFVRPFSSRFANEALNAGVIQPAIQGVAGGGTESLAQLATEGEITAPGQILAETAGEFFGAPLEVAPAAIDRVRRIRTGDPDVDVGVDEAQSALERARSRIRTQVSNYLDAADPVVPEAPTVPDVGTNVPNLGTSRLEQRRAEIAAREAEQTVRNPRMVEPEPTVRNPQTVPDDLDTLLAQRFAQDQEQTSPDVPENDPFAPAAEPEQAATLRGLDEEIGWLERGGRLLRAGDGVGLSGLGPEMGERSALESGTVVGRTSWQPKSDFWPVYRARDNNPLKEDEAKAALRKVDAGEKLTKREQRFIDYAREYAQQREAERLAEPIPPPTRKDEAFDRALRRYQQGLITEAEMEAIRAGELDPEDAIPFSRRRPQGPDLFGAPTSREQTEAAQRDVDARLSGAGTAVSMREGAGDLFAGPRPEQAQLAEGNANTRQKPLFSERRPTTEGMEVNEGDAEAIQAMQEMERRRIEDMPADQFAAMAMQVLGRNPGVFRTQLVPGRTVRETAEASGLTVAGFQNVGGRKVTEVRADQDKAGTATAFIVEDGDNVYLNVADLTAGGGAGERVYNAAFSYARNTGKNFVEDPEGLSDRALYRRPVQQTAMMMKAGSAENIGPGPYLTNPPDGPGVRPIRYDSKRRLTPTLAEHLRTVYANTVRAIPEAANVGYDFQRDAYFERGANGRPVRDLSDSDIDGLAAARRVNPVREAMVRDGLTGEGGKSPAPVGGNTIKVAAIADSLLRAQGAERSAILGELGSLASGGERPFPRGLREILPSRRGAAESAQQRRNLKTINVEVTTSDGETVTARADVVLRAAEKRLNALAMLADCIRR